MKLIPDEMVAGLLNYLAQRPYREVAQVIEALSHLAEAPKAAVMNLEALEKQMADSLGR